MTPAVMRSVKMLLSHNDIPCTSLRLSGSESGTAVDPIVPVFGSQRKTGHGAFPLTWFRTGGVLKKSGHLRSCG